MENERLLSERLLSVDEMHADCKMKPLGELLISQDAKTMAARDKWWVTGGDKFFNHPEQFCINIKTSRCSVCSEQVKPGCVYFQWQSLKQSLEVKE